MTKPLRVMTLAERIQSSEVLAGLMVDNLDAINESFVDEYLSAVTLAAIDALASARRLEMYVTKLADLVMGRQSTDPSLVRLHQTRPPAATSPSEGISAS